MASEKKPLTVKQAEFLGNFRALLERYGTPPTLEELGRETGVKKATSQAFVRRLIAKGYLRRAIHRRFHNLELVK